MRQGHQNRRGRGRGNQNNNNNNNNNNNRKGQNPLTRTFESNGPDVKIRGTPAHIAEKYISLARDAKSSGDEVLAENYLQHAEHYNRIILAFREQQISQGGGDPAAGGMGQRFRVPQLNDGPDDEIGEDGEDFGSGEQPNVMRGNEPQPGVQPQQPFEGGEQPQRVDRPEQRDRYERQDGRDYNRQDGRGDRDRHGGHRFDDRQRRHPDQFRNRDRDRDRDRGEGGRQDYGRQGGYDRDRGYDRRDRGPDRGPDRGSDRGMDRGPEAASERQGMERPQGDRMGMDRPPMDRGPVERPHERPQVAGEQAGFAPERVPAPAPAPVAAGAMEPSIDAANGASPRAPRPEGGAPRRRERFQAHHDQPEFLRRPVRRPRRDAAAAEGGDGEAAPAGGEAPAGRDDAGSAE